MGAPKLLPMKAPSELLLGSSRELLEIALRKLLGGAPMESFGVSF